MTKKIIIQLLLILVAQHVVKAQLSGNYYIGSGKDYENISSAVAALVNKGIADDVYFYLDTGQYSEQVIIPYIQGTSATSVVNFIAPEQGKVVWTAMPDTSLGLFTLLLDGAYYISFKNIVFTSDTAAGIPVEIRKDASVNMFINCVFKAPEGSKQPLLKSSETSYSPKQYNYFDQNVFQGGNFGMYLEGNEFAHDGYFIIKNNTFTNQNVAGIYGMYQAYTEIRNNFFVLTADSFGLTGILLNRSPYEPSVYNNYFYLNSPADASSAIKIEKSTGSEQFHIHLYNNMIFIRSQGLSMGFFILQSDIVELVHNTVHITGSAVQSIAMNILFSRGIRLFNNLFVNNGGGFLVSLSQTSSSTFDYNAYYGTGQSLFSEDNSYFSTLDNWSANTGYDEHSYFQQPLFCSDSNLHLSEPFLPDSIPLYTGMKKDFDGEKRSAVNPGADEYHLILPEIVHDTSLCAHQQISLEIKNFKSFDSVQWNEFPAGEKILFKPVRNNLYDSFVYALTWKHGCLKKDSSRIQVYPFPEFDLGPPDTLCKDTFHYYYLPGGNPYYHWHNGSTDSFFRADSLSLKPGVNLIYATVKNKFNCAFTDTLYLTLKNCDTTSSINHKELPFKISYSGENISIFCPGPFSIQMYDMHGRIKWAQTSSNNFNFNMNTLSSGIYIARIQYQGKVYSFRILKR